MLPVFFLFAPSAYAATSAELTGTVRQGSDAVSATTHTFSFDVDGTGANMTLFCVTDPNTGSSLLKSATWNGQATTSAGSGSTAVAGAQLGGTNMVWFANPATGTHNLVLTFGVAKGPIGYTCFTFKNVKQSGQNDKTGANNNAGSGTSASTASITSSSGSSFMIGWQLVNAGASNLAPTDGTQIGSTVTNPSGFLMAVSWKSATGGADTLSYSWTTNKPWDNWSDSFFDEPPAAALTTSILGLVRAFWIF